MPAGMAPERSKSFSGLVMPPPEANAAYFYMDKARQKYKANPQLFQPERLPAKIPTPEELDYDERLDRGVARSNHMLQEAIQQLAKPCVAPKDLTPSERAEKENAEAWTRGYEAANRTNDQWLDRTQQHFDDFMATLDDLEAQTITIAADIDVTAEPKTPTIDRLTTQDQAKHWLKGSWEFREFRDADFAAARRAEQSAQRYPFAADLYGHSRASSAPPSNHSRDSSIWNGAEYLGGALQETLTRSSLSIRHRVRSSVGSIALQNIFKVDKTVKWTLQYRFVILMANIVAPGKRLGRVVIREAARRSPNLSLEAALEKVSSVGPKSTLQARTAAFERHYENRRSMQLAGQNT